LVDPGFLSPTLKFLLSIAVRLSQETRLFVRPSVRSSVRLCLDTVNESQRRRHGVTVTLCRACLTVRPSLRWSLTHTVSWYLVYSSVVIAVTLC